MRRLLVLVSGRAAAIRFAPLILRLRQIPSMQMTVCAVQAHGDGVVHELSNFGLEPDEVLDAANAVHSGLSSGVDALIGTHRPDCVLVHGDADALMASFRRKAAYGNLGNGLRAYELHHHAVEPGKRPLIDLTATQYFVTTETARVNLRREGVPFENIFVADSTAVDALQMVSERIAGDSALNARLATAFPFIAPGKRMVLVVGNRRENDSALLESACRALKRLAMRTDVQVVYPLHPDPRMHSIADDVFADHPDIHVIEQQDYLHHVYLMQTAHLVLTDSGEIQEEAYSLGKPLLLMRGVDERPHAVDGGSIKLVGTDTEHIVRECSMFLDDPAYYRAFAGQHRSRGDGQASLHIAETLLR